MTVIREYYRASGRDVATIQPERSRVELGFDIVVVDWVDPYVALGKLLSIITRKPYRPGRINEVHLYPRPEDDLNEYCEESDGATIIEFPTRVRDILADVDDSLLSTIASEWRRIEEFSDLSAITEGYSQALVRDLVGLARRAKDNAQMLYCWSL